MSHHIERLEHLYRLIARKEDFLMVAERPDRGWREPSSKYPTGRWAFPVAIAKVSDWDDEIIGEVRLTIIRHLPWWIKWIRITRWWCPPLWYIGHETATATVLRALQDGGKADG